MYKDQVTDVPFRTCKYCGITKSSLLFRTRNVCNECRYEYQKKRETKKPNYRRWGKYIDDCKLDDSKNFICKKCGKKDKGSNFISRFTCKDCNYKKQRVYLKKVGTPTGKYWQIRQSAKNRNISLEMEISDFVDWWNKQDRKCLYCGRTEEEVKNSTDVLDSKTHKLSIDRMDNSKGYSLSNITLACPRCNTLKGNFFTKEEMLEVGKIIKKKFDDEKKFNNIIYSM